MRKSRLIIAVAVAALGVAALAGCSTSTINNGTVTSKEHHNSYFYPQKIGKVTVMHTVPERWEVCFKGENKTHEVETRCVDVEEFTYDHTNVGDNFTLQK